MKKSINSVISLVLALVCVFTFVACGNSEDATGLWENATYQSDTELGSGSKTISVQVEAEDKTIVFKIHTDASTVGEALLENEIVAGEDGDYGLYIKSVNGITADYSVDQSYWAFYIDGEMAATGVDGAEIDESVTYGLVYTK